jgi:hypothetical protein
MAFFWEVDLKEVMKSLDVYPVIVVSYSQVFFHPFCSFKIQSWMPSICTYIYTYNHPEVDRIWYFHEFANIFPL